MARQPFKVVPLRREMMAEDESAAFREFSASELFCPKCRRAMPVREKLLLVLPSGALYDYLCAGCGSSLGTKRG